MEGKGIINGHEYVDLGLPSGTLWATCNVGANQPYEKGNYYAWGETSTKITYSMDNYKFCQGSRITKYTKSDRLNILKASDDAASVNWGGAWHMPTKENFEELWRNCKWEEYWMDAPQRELGVPGNMVTGPNGNSIFMPTAGVLDEHGRSSGKNDGHYWTRTHGTLEYGAWRMRFFLSVEKNEVNECFIHFGLPVRPVVSKNDVRRNSTSSTNSKSNGGCYVATAVYGSYNCPQVWVLRRFRDNTLDATWYGRAFIQTYYAISPTLVKWFGETSWFRKLWRRPLDRLVTSLKSKGVEDSPYTDNY